MPFRFLRLTLLTQPAPAKAGVVGFLDVLIIHLRSLLLAPLKRDSAAYELQVIRVLLSLRYPVESIRHH